jgi:hypothetical protein
MALLTISKPTQQQVVHGIDRVLLVFVAVTSTDWVKSPNPFGKAAILGACAGGAVAVWQALLSIFTTL